MNLKKSLILVNVFITVLIVWMVISIVYTWASNIGAKKNALAVSSSAERPVEKTTPVSKSEKDYQLIVKKDVFNTSEDASNSPLVKRDISNAEATSLNLKLRGTAVGDNNDSFAIIYDGSTGKEDLYELNDTIQNARIVDILTDRVILDINGREESLILPVESSPGIRRINRRPPTSTYRPSKRPYNLPKKVVRPKTPSISPSQP